MNSRRGFLLTLTAGLVALAVIITPVIAAELLGVITKVDVAGKKVTVVRDDNGKEVEITTTDDTEYTSKKGTRKLDLEELTKSLQKVQDGGKKGIRVTVTHEKKVASKIEKSANQ